MIRLQPVVVLGVALFMLGRVGQPVWMVLALHLAALFVSSMVCHGELAKDRPSVGRLTDFYLTMSLGGVLGGLFNALAAPLIFHSAAEYPIALIAACALCPRKTSVSAGRWTNRTLDLFWPILVVALAWGMPRGMKAILGHDSISLQMIALGVAIMAGGMAIQRRTRFVLSLTALFFVAGLGAAKGEVLAVRRSFFGIHRVVRNSDGPFNDLYHGTTVHGRQIVSDGGVPSEPTTALTYYHRTGPIGQILAQRTAAGEAKRIGVVGLGARRQPAVMPVPRNATDLL